MESSYSSASSTSTPSNWAYVAVFVVRPVLAISFAISFIFLWWFVAWKLVLVHVPLVQEIFGLRKKTVKPKPEIRRRLSGYYNSIRSTQNLNS